MEASILAAKLKLRPGDRAALIGAPEDYRDELEPLPEGVELSTALDGAYDWLQVFAATRADLERLAPALPSALKPGGRLWISFPKGESGRQADLTRDKGWEPMASLDLKWISLVSVDETWSAFALRHHKPGEERRPWR